MFIGIFVPFINNFGKEGYYNSQEIGLAKALAKKKHEIIIYKLTKEKITSIQKEIEKNVYIKYVSAKALGSNGIIRFNHLDKKINVLICFSDLQLIVPSIYVWCKKNHILFLPYIGVLESHSNNFILKKIMDFLSYRNIRIYKKCHSLVKNKKVYEILKNYDFDKITLVPVGVDLDKMNMNYKHENITKLKIKYGYKEEDRIVLFIGRLDCEKNPIDLIRYFEKVYKIDNSYRLLIVGEGILQDEVEKEISRRKLENVVKQIKKMPNTEIWELYRISECFINLNKQEIFGMAILESMYYETKTIAWHAPGPDLIIENNVSGYLVNNENELFEKISIQNESVKENAHKRIVECFTWDRTAKEINNIIQNYI